MDDKSRPAWPKEITNSRFIGVRIGNHVFGKGSLDRGDTVIDVGAEVYAGIGGGVNLSINISEIRRRMKDLF